nr:MAG TPA: hypothetical protein [Caudoviricetes sp.]
MQCRTTTHTDSPTPRSRSDITYIHERKSTEKHPGNTMETPLGHRPAGIPEPSSSPSERHPQGDTNHYKHLTSISIAGERSCNRHT